jgi:hypothetical protein
VYGLEVVFLEWFKCFQKLVFQKNFRKNFGEIFGGMLFFGYIGGIKKV